MKCHMKLIMSALHEGWMNLRYKSFRNRSTRPFTVGWNDLVLNCEFQKPSQLSIRCIFTFFRSSIPNNWEVWPCASLVRYSFLVKKIAEIRDLCLGWESFLFLQRNCKNKNKMGKLSWSNQWGKMSLYSVLAFKQKFNNIPHCRRLEKRSRHQIRI